MRKSILAVSLFCATLIELASCKIECIDKKTGMHKASQTLREAREKELYRYQFIAEKQTYQLESGLIFKIQNAWVENSWTYECTNSKAVLVKDSSLQFVIDAEFKGDVTRTNYWLDNRHLGALLRFGYSGQDTIALTLYKDTSIGSAEKKQEIDVITFVRQQPSR